MMRIFHFSYSKRHLKDIILKTWDDVAMIPQAPNQSPLLCSSSLPVYIVIQQAVLLNNNNCSDHDELEYFDDEPDKLQESDDSILHKAAGIIKSRIKKIELPQDEYYTAHEIKLSEQVKFLDPLLCKFIGWLHSEN